MANNFPSAEALLKCTVIVPVFNHWDLSPDLLDSLKCQTLDQVHFEVLLVDNGSAFVPSNLELEPNTSILYCSIPGSYAARNMAIKQANGKIIAFTDADCRPSYSWLKNGLDHFLPENSVSLILAGAISVEPKNWNNLTPAESYDIALGLPQQRYTKRGYGVTANLFVPKVLFNKYGYFDQRRFSGGDAEFCRRVLKRRVILNYCKKNSRYSSCSPNLGFPGKESTSSKRRANQSRKVPSSNCFCFTNVTPSNTRMASGIET